MRSQHGTVVALLMVLAANVSIGILTISDVTNYASHHSYMASNAAFRDSGATAVR
jgi:predicted transcriptional regulator